MHVLTAVPGEAWIEPMPDGHALPDDADPYELTALCQSIRLAFVAAPQHLPPKQRTVLIGGGRGDDAVVLRRMNEGGASAHSLGVRGCGAAARCDRKVAPSAVTKRAK